ncbi:hypothetical protein A6768_11585 [Sphingobium yanoikuyae]|uniref:TIGR04255 family protein n=1 Tax=Sphingobium yanoikuyae TaxID=13690 RepID=A0A291MZP3_SPHYA|nr:hypothetical protein A6768_11585 [Sphingobium yanoikuyae]
MIQNLTLPSPLGGPPPEEVTLPRAPLARVLAQVRYPSILYIGEKSRLAPFQADVRAQYPIFREDSGQNFKVEMSPGGPAIETERSTLWRFGSVDGVWLITLTPEAVTLETRAYESRAEFVQRLAHVLACVETHFAPGIAERISMRYVTRVTDEGYDRIDDMVEPGLLGLAIPEFRRHVTHAISEAAIEIEEGALFLRWGVLPPNGTFDPFVLEPIGKPSWVIDIDVSITGFTDFKAGALADHFYALAKRAYAIFRHMVTDAFLALYGGRS